MVFFGSILEGSVRMYMCDVNFIVEGDIVMICRVDGIWSNINLYCRCKNKLLKCILEKKIN